MMMKSFVRSDREVPYGGIAYGNGKYQVTLRPQGELVMLSIRREDRRPIMDWRDLQWIKNELVGPEREAIQVFPAESRLVDTANQYYLWALPEGVKLQFGFAERAVSERLEVVIDGQPSMQRPFADHVRPADLAECEEKLSGQLAEAGWDARKVHL